MLVKLTPVDICVHGRTIFRIQLVNLIQLLAEKNRLLLAMKPNV
jgi:hypothetical protein